jgi:hypothetical protein
MDERVLFELFHDALAIEPRPGSYERMRIALTTYPVPLKRLPVFRMRWTKVGFRTAAALTAVVLAIALVAAFLLTRHGPVADVPAGQDRGVVAYQAMFQSDYHTLVDSTSNHCNTIEDQDCEAAAKQVTATAQQWIDHLESFRTPSRYAVLDLQLRYHLREVIVELNAAVAFQKAHDEKGFRLAMNGAYYERGWIDTPVNLVAADTGKQAASYEDAFSLSKQILSKCINGAPVSGGPCAKVTQQPSCLGIYAELCQSYVQDSQTQMLIMMVALTQSPAPPDKAAKSAKLQTYLAQADTALLAIIDAMLKGDAAKIDAAQQTFAGALLHAGYIS